MKFISSGVYFNQIDTFRFFAVFLVLVSHWLNGAAYYDTLEQMHLGAIGVEFFFVISGFLISLQLMSYKEAVNRKEVSFGKAIKTFFIRRVLRIFPLYYFVLFLATVFNDGEIREAFWWNLTYLSNFYFIKVQSWNPIFSHFWSLSVEEHFYLGWPFLLLFFKRKIYPYLFLIISLIAIGFRWYSFSTLEGYYFDTYAHTLSCLDLFMFGGALAFLYRYKKDWFEKLFASGWQRYLVFFGFLMLMIFWMKNDKVEIFKVVYLRFIIGIFYTFTIGFLVVGVKGFFGKVFNNKTLIYLGKLSYGIYLIHNFVPGLLLEIKKLNLYLEVEFVIYLIVTILISMILQKVIELPFRRLNRHFKIREHK